MAKKTDQGILDLDNYAAMCVPHESRDAADAAYKAFWDDVYEARKKHRIKEVVLCVEMLYETDEGEVGRQTGGSMGSASLAMELLASVYGTMRSQFAEKLDRLATRGPKP